MRLYYTTSVKGGADPQDKINLSLGGYLSAIPVPKKALDNFFGEITEYTKANAQEQYICLFLVNELGVEVKNVRAYFEHPEGCYSKIKIAASSLSGDASERIKDMYSAPFYIDEFFEAEGQGDAFNIGDLPVDDMVAIWLERSILEDVIKENKLYERVDDYLVKEVEQKTVDEIKFYIEWD